MRNIALKRVYLFSILLFLMNIVSAQNNSNLRIEPPNWWVGMKNPNLQLLVHAKDIAQCNVSISYSGINIEQVIKVESPNYLFLNLQIAPETKAGTFNIDFTKGKKVIASYHYELKQRNQGSANRKSFTNADAIYLIMPDRFCNGDTANDNVATVFEKANRTDPNGRHGGDIKGIESKLGYIADLGYSAIWMTPLVENNQQKYSYHGYSITDFYKTDPRFGSNSDYFQMVQMAHQKGIKVIMDMIFNHCGSNHWWMSDLPMKDWINQWPEFTRSNYRGSASVDPYASQYDKDRMLKGWFDNTMPDINQHNLLMATYLIQNSIWWVEAAALDGIRIDTYPYPFKDFTSQWAKSLTDEYPNLNMVGEVWMSKPSMIAYYQKDAKTTDGYNGYLPSVFDFPLFYALGKAFNETESWDKGLVQLYDVLSEDFLYPDPLNMVTFIGNHDTERLYDIISQNYNNYKMAVACLLTIRGIPLMYYGDEILMTGKKSNGDGDIRKDFPGGWPNDAVDAFTSNGRTKEQQDAFNYTRNLLRWRHSHTVLQTGALTHFVPEDGTYVYFRSNEKEKVMVILNNTDSNKGLKTQRFAECMQGYSSAFDVINNNKITDLNVINVPAKSALILELKK